MEVDIWSDIVCPWCYLGKRRFEQALETFAQRDDVRIEHRSFQLDPSKPRHQTSSRRTMLKAKYHLTDAQVQEMDTKMERMAAAEGLEYHLTDAGLTGNTLDAHQLVQLAKARGIQDAVLDRLYRAYFTEQRSVFDRESLVTVVAEAGLDPEEARQVLERDAYVDAVSADLSEARRLGVSGVPFFVIGGQLGVSGAQRTDVFSQALTRAWDESTPGPAVAGP
ncbi:MAG TPA: DsbA family oxidoreductase [Vicinamibacterales bacterium]|nr:DsbA family oxidoreductase [Vicinamibacterales bacterium]